jgi:hypothetical protein
MLNMFNMLKTISLLVYISFIHTIYIDKLNPYFKKQSSGLLAGTIKAVDTPIATENITKVRPMRGKQCNFKCDCFFSHSVKNDNICVPFWIKPLGL